MRWPTTLIADELHFSEQECVMINEQLAVIGPDELQEAFTRVVMKCPSWLVIFQITDVFGWKARFNTPGSVAASNWSYRIQSTVAELDQDPVLRSRSERFSRLARESGRAIEAALLD